MLDASSHQAAGLMGMAPSPGPQLLAMVSHGDDQMELPLLWQLCATLVDMGYAVTVLDGTQAESGANPGLSYLLRYSVVHESMASERPEWTIVPAAQGVYNLCSTESDPQHNLVQLGRLFPPNGILILYCGADHTARLLEGSAVKPLMVVSSTKGSLLTSYWALKRVLIKGRLEPTILDMTQETAYSAASAQPSIASNLSDCAKNFLGHDVQVLRMPAAALMGRSGSDVRRLALRLLDSALALASSKSQPALPTAPVFAPQHSRSH
jgi:hypothetical protein